MIYSVTGHRPNKLGGYSEQLFDKLIRFARKQILITKPAKVLSGMALGWDQAVAGACVQVGVPFIAVVPYRNYGENWPLDSQSSLDILLELASDVVYVSDNPYYQPWLMQSRNEWMVDNSEAILALWNGTDGGTKNCIKYANKVNKPYVNFWNEWLEFEKE